MVENDENTIALVALYLEREGFRSIPTSDAPRPLKGDD